MYRPRLNRLSAAHVWVLLAVLLAVVGGCKRSKETADTPATKAASLETKIDVPQDVVYAASAHLRIVDVALGQVVTGIDLGRAVSDIAFSTDGRRAYLAASDGVHEIDAEAKTHVTKLTQHPARKVIALSDQALVVLEHEVTVKKDGTRDVSPFRLVTVDIERREVVSTEEIGQRIFFAIPATGADRQAVIVTESSELKLAAQGTPLADAVPLKVEGTYPPKGAFTVRPFVTMSSDQRFVYVPVEGAASQIVEIDRQTGKLRSIALGEAVLLRGLALTLDGKSIVVNASNRALILDKATGKKQAELSLEAGHTGAAMSVDGKRVYFAKTVDGTGGALSVIRLDPIKLQGKIHFDDISPWTLAVRPKAAFARAD